MIFIVVAAIAIIILIIVVSVLRGRKKHSPKSKGEQGEELVAEALGDTIKGKQYVINNLLFENAEGKSCQIDHIFINKYGIWVIETKNYAGKIYGQENYLEWTQVLAYGNTKNKFYNPIRQNTTHINQLSKYLQVKNIFQNVVVFLDHADISDIVSDNVYSIDRLQDIKNQVTDISLSVEQMKEYYDKLLELKNNVKINVDDHIENIHEMQKQIQQGICPRCGKPLVLRDGENGKFYGCPNFPACKFTKKVD